MLLQIRKKSAIFVCGLKYSSFPLQSDAMFETRYFCSAKYEALNGKEEAEKTCVSFIHGPPQQVPQLFSLN